MNLENKVAALIGAGGVTCSTMVVKVALININAEAIEKLSQEIKNEFKVPSIGVGASILDKGSLR